jgi:hypothetical protein
MTLPPLSCLAAAISSTSARTFPIELFREKITQHLGEQSFGVLMLGCNGRSHVTLNASVDLCRAQTWCPPIRSVRFSPLSKFLLSFVSSNRKKGRGLINGTI